MEKNAGAGDDHGGEKIGEVEPEIDRDLKRLKAGFEELCNEDKILTFFKKLLNERGQELEEMPEAETRTAKGKLVVTTFNQCARCLNPMFKMCRKKVRFHLSILEFLRYETFDMNILLGSRKTKFN